jgi:2C-methyl-D-erythritol 2,4-cyclodiphosphate synthase
VNSPKVSRNNTNSLKSYDDTDDVTVEENYRMYLTCLEKIFKTYNFDIGNIDIKNAMDLVTMIPKIA